jgi:hypothetical protein
MALIDVWPDTFVQIERPFPWVFLEQMEKRVGGFKEESTSLSMADVPLKITTQLPPREIISWHLTRRQH